MLRHEPAAVDALMTSADKRLGFPWGRAKATHTHSQETQSPRVHSSVLMQETGHPLCMCVRERNRLASLLSRIWDVSLKIKVSEEGRDGSCHGYWGSTRGMMDKERSETGRDKEPLPFSLGVGSVCCWGTLPGCSGNPCSCTP